MKNAVQALQAVARRRGEYAEVHIRSAAIDNKIYIDLADDQHRVVEISAGGWRIINDPPIKFLRPAGMRPLPEPRHGGSIKQLRPYTNLTDVGFILFIQWLIDALHRRVERPVACLLVARVAGNRAWQKSRNASLTPELRTEAIRRRPFVSSPLGPVMGLWLIFDN